MASFYSYLRLPADVVRVCTGPVCDCLGGRALLEQSPGAVEVPCIGHCDLAPAMMRGDEVVPGRDARGESRSVDRPARAGRAARPAGARSRPDRGRARGLRARRLRRRRLPDLPQVGGRARLPRPARRDRERRRGRARDDQGPLRDGAAAAPARRGDRDRDALRGGRRGLRLPPGGVHDGARAPVRGAGRTWAPGHDRHRRRLVRLRRGDGDARVDGGPPRHAPPAPAVPGRGRLPRPPDADQQRRDARSHPGHPARSAARPGRASVSGRSRARSRSRAATRRRSTPPPGS